MNMEPMDHLTEADLSVDREVTTQLAETAKWTKFIGVTFFVCCALMVLALTVASASLPRIMDKFSSSFGALGSAGTAFMVIFIILFVLVLCALAYFLVNFSAKVKAGIELENTESLNKGLNSLKLYFIISAVLAILGILSSLKDITNYF